jgi:hypothetical protein
MGVKSKKCSVLTVFLTVLFYLFSGAGTATAIYVEPHDRFNLRLVTPIENNSGFRVWESKYYPGDVLSQKMSDYVYRRMKEIHRVNPIRLVSNIPDFWPTEDFSGKDRILRISLERFDYLKKDTLGSKIYWDVIFHAYVYDGSTRELLFDSVIEESDERQYVLYQDILDTEPIYWQNFEKSPYWPVMRRALDRVLAEVVDGYNGYRVVGQIIAKAERVDGSLGIPKKKQDKIYHVNIGRQDSVQVGDVLSVLRSSSVRTIAPETPELHFPQIIGRVRVISVKDRDAVVEIVKESAEGPIQLGDSVSMPLRGRRDGNDF